MFKVLQVPGSDTLHISYRRPKSMLWETDKTACLMEAEDGDQPFTVVGGRPTCPFCIRDAEIPEELKPILAGGVT